MNRIIYIAAIAATTLFAACHKKDNSTYDKAKKSTLSIEFDNIVGNQDLQLNTATYTNVSGEQFNISKLKYYVSNFVFTNVDGSTYIVPQDDSYYLIDESNTAQHEAAMNIPEGEYKTVQFIVGVDSLRNTLSTDKRTGVLDVTAQGADMYWSWNSGYIFLKMEGTAPASPATANAFQYHIGLYGGMSTPTVNNVKTITLDLSARGNAKVKTGNSPNVHLLVDVMKIFNGTTSVKIAEHPTVMVTTFSKTIADNYANMFSHDHTEN